MFFCQSTGWVAILEFTDVYGVVYTSRVPVAVWKDCGEEIVGMIAKDAYGQQFPFLIKAPEAIGFIAYELDTPHIPAA